MSPPKHTGKYNSFIYRGGRVCKVITEESVIDLSVNFGNGISRKHMCKVQSTHMASKTGKNQKQEAEAREGIKSDVSSVSSPWGDLEATS